MNPLAKAVFDKAITNYEKSFEWSSIYETYTESEILEELSQARVTTTTGAVRHFTAIVRAREDSDHSG